MGRTDRALEVFQQARDREYFQTQIATLMAQQGRIEKALAVLPRDKDRQLLRPYKLA
jgi:hypothetical protein